MQVAKELIDGEDGVPHMNSKTKIDPKSQKYAENWLPVRGIQNGEIILDNGYRVTGVKVRPRNIFILDYDSQSNAIFNLRNFYNTLDYEFWLIVADRPVDINVYLSQLQVLYGKTNDNKKRKLILEDLNKANMFMSNNVVDTEYFILFKTSLFGWPYLLFFQTLIIEYFGFISLISFSLLLVLLP